MYAYDYNSNSKDDENESVVLKMDMNNVKNNSSFSFINEANFSFINISESEGKDQYYLGTIISQEKGSNMILEATTFRIYVKEPKEDITSYSKVKESFIQNKITLKNPERKEAKRSLFPSQVNENSEARLLRSSNSQLSQTETNPQRVC